MPKQDGQATVANRAPQCSQDVASDEAAAPHIGRLSVSAGMDAVTIGRARFFWQDVFHSGCEGCAAQRGLADTIRFAQNSAKRD
ncbi:MAG: hypothetical protein EXS33_07355 [Pedosphaera sp.]|nr:hypothetical protein [Pedosphaera sp.]